MEFDTTRLKHLVPVNQLQNEHRLRLLDQSHIIDLQVGDELRANEEFRWYEFLIEGKVDLLESGQPPSLLIASDERALFPLFSEAQHRTYLIAQSHCKIIRFDKELFKTFQDDEIISGEELETVEMSDTEGNLFNEIMHAFNVGNLKLPSLPEVAVNVQSAMQKPATNAESLALIIAADPAIAIRLINAANGPLSRAIDPINNIQAAVVRLGLKVSRELVISFAIRQLFTSKSEMLQKRMRKLYEQSIDVAAIGFALSKQSGFLSPDHILLAGLLHEIGVIPILSYIEDTGLLIENENELEAIINSLRGVVGSMVVQYWELSSDLDAVVGDYENWQRESGDKVDACDMIMVAQIYSRLKDHKIKGLPKIDQVPAFKKIFPGDKETDFAAHVFEQAQQEISEIKQLLKM